MRRNHQRDANQGAIVKALRELGLTVRVTSHFGDGFPDLLVHRSGRTVGLEIKDGRLPKHRRRLSPAEEIFQAQFPGFVVVVESVEDALSALGFVKPAPDYILDRRGMP